MEWHGWLWQHNGWQRVTGPHAALSECSRDLGRIGEARGVPCKFQIMTTGACPRVSPTHGVAPAERSAVKTSRRP